MSSGILLGSGNQKIAAIANLVSYYCIGLPLGILLMFAAKLRILGNHISILRYDVLPGSLSNPKRSVMLIKMSSDQILKRILNQCFTCLSKSYFLKKLFVFVFLDFSGLTLSLLVCVVIQACFFITVIFKLDWQKLTVKVRL